MLASVFGSNLASLTLSASSLPLPTSLGGVSATVNGVSAPLYYVSPTQINLQIPYGTSSSTATLVVTSNGRTATMTLPVSAVAPGIFTDANGGLVPVRTAGRGGTVTMYVTGQGAVYPTIPSGSAPAPGSSVANLPSPLGSIRVTVGGSTSSVQFAGIPIGLVGIMQVNFIVPFNAALGTQPVVVSIGGFSSPPVNLTVTAQ